MEKIIFNSGINHIDGKNLPVSEVINQIKLAVQHPAAQLVITPRVDVAQKAYYWLGLRVERNEADFKLPVNEQVMKFILAFIMGEEVLPEVTDFEPLSGIADMEQWLNEHYDKHSSKANSVSKEFQSGNGGFYLTFTLKFTRGKIKYPSKKFDSMFGMLVGA